MRTSTLSTPNWQFHWKMLQSGDKFVHSIKGIPYSRPELPQCHESVCCQLSNCSSAIGSPPSPAVSVWPAVSPLPAPVRVLKAQSPHHPAGFPPFQQSTYALVPGTSGNGVHRIQRWCRFLCMLQHFSDASISSASSLGHVRWASSLLDATAVRKLRH